jgi:EpsI family protein
MAYYGGGQQGGKLVSSVNQLYDRPYWSRTGEGRRLAEFNGQPIEMHEVLVQSADSSLVIWHCYWVGGVFTSNDYRAKLLQAKARLLGRRRGSVAIVLAAESPPPQSQGSTVLGDFLKHVALQEDLRLSLKESR